MRLVVDSASHFPPEVIGQALARLWKLDGCSIVPALDACDEEPVCPITRRPMENPVLVGDSGSVYECDAVVQWLQGSDRDPCTNLKLRNPRVLKLEPLRQAIERFLNLEAQSRKGGVSGLGLGAASASLESVSREAAAVAAAARASMAAAAPAPPALQHELVQRLEARLEEARRQLHETERLIDEAEPLVDDLRKAITERQKLRYTVRRIQSAARQALTRRRAGGLARSCSAALRAEGPKLVGEAASRFGRWWRCCYAELSASKSAAKGQPLWHAGIFLDIPEDSDGAEGSDRSRMIEREALVREMFALLTVHGSVHMAPRLGEPGLFEFATLCGFNGGRSRWQEEYLAVCRHFSWNAEQGATLSQFTDLVDDPTGCGYCTLRELREMLPDLRRRSARCIPGSSYFGSDGETTQAESSFFGSRRETDDDTPLSASRATSASSASSGSYSDDGEDEDDRGDDDARTIYMSEGVPDEDLDAAPPTGTFVDILYEDNVWYRAVVVHSECGRYATVRAEHSGEEDVVDLTMHSVRLPRSERRSQSVGRQAAVAATTVTAAASAGARGAVGMRGDHSPQRTRAASPPLRTFRGAAGIACAAGRGLCHRVGVSRSLPPAPRPSPTE